MKFRAPAKLILSGEHAVVHGAPALALAVDYYTTAEVESQSVPAISLSLPNYNYQCTLDLSALDEVRERIQQQYKSFLQKKCPINQVLQQPTELIEYTLSTIIPTYKIQKGMKLTLTSNIPVSCGMGSSAAAIISTMFAVTSYAGFQLSPEELYPLALTVENMQHGHSSGLDLQLALHGGCFYRNENELIPRQIAAMPLYLVNTGTPVITTGECVTTAKAYFTGEKDTLLAAFSEVTNAMDRAWQANKLVQVAEAIKANHQLLSHIGVVPTKVQQFIAQLEANNAAAKICGAGAISGDNAGVVAVLTQDRDALAAICDQYHYSYAPVVGAARGVYEF